MKTKTLGFIGGGRITRIILQAFKNESVEFDSIIVFDPNTETLNTLMKQFPKIKIADSAETPARQDIVFLAVHPPVMMETLDRIKEVVNDDSVVISLAPKITLEKMDSVIPARKLIRMIPNATSFINKGYNPVTFHSSIAVDEKLILYKLLKVMGKTMEVDEDKLESYAIVSAMLPTYFWFQWEKLQDIGIQIGLNEKECRKAIHETLIAAIQLFYNSGLTSEEVIDLIPVKPIAEHEAAIKECLTGKLLPLFEKIKP